MKFQIKQKARKQRIYTVSELFALVTRTGIESGPRCFLQNHKYTYNCVNTPFLNDDARAYNKLK